MKITYYGQLRLIGESTQLRLAVLCIGDNFTMGIEDAIKAAEMVRCDNILGVHYDTFPPIKIDQQAALEKFRAANKTLHLLRIGESRDF
jgi:L-ascorbate metabolism protein UlaG (beta-lactamase superfamily)